MCQSVPSRATNMLRLALLLFSLAHHIRTADLDAPLSDRLDRIYEKLERFMIENTSQKQELTPHEKLYAKLDKLNSITPEKELSDDDEDLLSHMQRWGGLTGDQLEGVVREMQRMKEDKSEKLVESEYGDADWPDEEDEYANDDWDGEYSDSSTAKPVTPSAITRLQDRLAEETVTVDPIAATNERPRMLDDSSITQSQRSALVEAALTHIKSVVRSSKCLTPQPRWLSMKQLAPAADTVYMPPCIELHRCVPDSGCCYDESQVCAPDKGEYVTLPFYLTKADGSVPVARMVFFNHTSCACVPRESLMTSTSTERSRVERIRDNFLVRRESVISERQNDWRSTEEPKLEKDEELEDVTAPPELRRCTCPTLFMSKAVNGQCSCVCDWPELSRRRDCLSFARGREHFGLRDRVCVVNGDCTAPTCEYGAFDRGSGRCPYRRIRRVRYHHRTRPVVL